MIDVGLLASLYMSLLGQQPSKVENATSQIRSVVDPVFRRLHKQLKQAMAAPSIPAAAATGRRDTRPEISLLAQGLLKFIA